MKGEDRQNTFLLLSFDLAIKVVIKHFFLGFELDLFLERDYSIVFYILHHNILLLDRNNTTFIARFDKEFLRGKLLVFRLLANHDRC